MKKRRQKDPWLCRGCPPCWQGYPLRVCFNAADVQSPKAQV